MSTRVLLCPTVSPSPRQISPEAADLLRRMLVTDPAERADVAAVMGHPWFRRDLDPRLAGLNDALLADRGPRPSGVRSCATSDEVRSTPARRCRMGRAVQSLPPALQACGHGVVAPLPTSIRRCLTRLFDRFLHPAVSSHCGAAHLGIRVSSSGHCAAQDLETIAMLSCHKPRRRALPPHMHHRRIASMPTRSPSSPLGVQPLPPGVKGGASNPTLGNSGCALTLAC